MSTTGYKKSTLLAKAVTQDTSYECTFVINGKDYKMNVDADVVGECRAVIPLSYKQFVSVIPLSYKQFELY